MSRLKIDHFALVYASSDCETRSTVIFSPDCPIGLIPLVKCSFWWVPWLRIPLPCLRSSWAWLRTFFLPFDLPIHDPYWVAINSLIPRWCELVGIHVCEKFGLIMLRDVIRAPSTEFRTCLSQDVDHQFESLLIVGYGWSKTLLNFVGGY